MKLWRHRLTARKTYSITCASSITGICRRSFCFWLICLRDAAVDFVILLVCVLRNECGVSECGARGRRDGSDIEEVCWWWWWWLVARLGFFCYSRTFLSIVGGVVAGVLGLTGVTGFLCYFVIMLLASAGIAVKTKFDVFSFFDSWNRITIDGIAQGFMVRALTFIPPFNLIPCFTNCATSSCEDMTLMQ